MRMGRQPLLRTFGFRGRRAALAVLVALTAAAAPPNKDAAKATNPAANLPPFVPAEFKPEHLASLAFTAPMTPRVGPWSAVGDIYAGAAPEAQVWSLRGAFSTKPGRMEAGAASLFLCGFGTAGDAPWLELAVLQAGEARDCWTLRNTDEVQPFPAAFRERGRIRDKHAIFSGGPEYSAYWQTLVMAHYTSQEAFARAALRDVNYVRLFNEPEDLRGQVVRVTGRLVRLLSFKAPDEARAEGVGELYEGWIMTDTFGENPVCVVFTDLPPGLRVGSSPRVNVEDVSCDGYYYKRYRYKAYDNKKANEYRDAPMLIAHTLTGRFGAAAGDGADPWGHNLIWVFLSVVGTAIVGVVGLTCWFRYHDRRVRQRLSATRQNAVVLPDEADGDIDLTSPER